MTDRDDDANDREMQSTPVRFDALLRNFSLVVSIRDLDRSAVGQIWPTTAEPPMTPKGARR